jgi:hypothetical protein
MAFGVAGQTVPWVVTPTSVSHTVSIGNANITVDNNVLQAGDVVGLFYDSLGTLACGGYAVWPSAEIISYGDDSGEPNGFLLNEPFKFKIWKKNDNCIIDSGSMVQFKYEPPIYKDSIFFKSNGMSKIITLNGSKKEIYYNKKSYCSLDPNPLPIKKGTVSDVVYSSQPGLVLNSSTGQINIAASLPGTYTIYFQTTLCLLSESFTVRIKFNIEDLVTTIKLPTCTEKGNLKIDESSILCGVPPYEYRIKNISSEEEINSFSSQINNIPEGAYELFVKDGTGTELKLPRIVSFEKECKDLIIAPYSDNNTSYFIPFGGTAKIYDRFGLLKKEMEIPADWNATDNSGSLVPAGQYLIICNDKKQIVVTVIK